MTLTNGPCSIDLRTVTCRQGVGNAAREIVAVSVHFFPGLFHVIEGDAASGKDLLLRAAGLLERPEAGEIFVDGRETGGLSEEHRAELRSRRVSFIFASPFLLPAFTLIENVAMPLFKATGASPSTARVLSEDLLAMVGLGGREQEFAGNLAPFEQHCAALARALSTEPGALLVESLEAFEDPEHAHRFAVLLRRIQAELGVTVVATTMLGFSRLAGDRLLTMAEGRLESDTAHLPHAAT